MPRFGFWNFLRTGTDSVFLKICWLLKFNSDLFTKLRLCWRLLIWSKLRVCFENWELVAKLNLKLWFSVFFINWDFAYIEIHVKITFVYKTETFLTAKITESLFWKLRPCCKTELKVVIGSFCLEKIWEECTKIETFEHA